MSQRIERNCMMRKQELNDRLSLNIYNKSCKHSEIENTVCEIEQSIVDVVFEEKHGQNLYLSDVIQHLNYQIDKTNLQNNEIVNNMMNSLYNFQSYIKYIKSGIKGEKTTEFILSSLKNETYCKILLNVSLGSGLFNSEADNIVITKRGIFIIETKMRKQNMIITEDGYFVSHKNKKTKGINVLDQLETQEILVREYLRNKGFKLNNCLVHTYLFFASKDYEVNDYSESGKVLRINNLNSTILNNDSFINLSNEEIDAYANALSKLSTDELSRIDFNLDSLRNNFVEGIILIEKELKKIEEPVSIKEKWRFDIKSALIGTGIAGSIYGISELVKYSSKQKALSA